MSRNRVIHWWGRVGIVGAVAHITGGGLPGNLPRALPADLDAVLVPGSWPVPRIFAEVQAASGADDAEMGRTFNMGLGMVVSVRPDQAEQALGVLRRHCLEASVVGRLTRGAGFCLFAPR